MPSMGRHTAGSRLNLWMYVDVRALDRPRNLRLEFVVLVAPDFSFLGPLRQRLRWLQRIDLPIVPEVLPLNVGDERLIS